MDDHLPLPSVVCCMLYVVCFLVLFFFISFLLWFFPLVNFVDFWDCVPASCHWSPHRGWVYHLLYVLKIVVSFLGRRTTKENVQANMPAKTPGRAPYSFLIADHKSDTALVSQALSPRSVDTGSTIGTWLQWTFQAISVREGSCPHQSPFWGIERVG